MSRAKFWVAWTYPKDSHREHADWFSEEHARTHVRVLQEVGMKDISIEFGPADASRPVEFN